MIKKIIVTVIALSIIVLIVLLRFSITHKDLANASVSGWQLQPETWSGTVTVTGDTRFALWVTLTITPGTKVLFQKNPDIPNTPWSKFADAYITDHNDPTGHTGYNKSHFDLAGKIIAVGTKEKPIIFTSAQAKPEYADWDQIVAYGGSEFEYVQVSYAHNGLYVGNEGGPFVGKRVSITNSSFHDALWSCIDIWGIDAVVSHNEIYHCWHQGIGTKKAATVTINNNMIHDAQLSINCELGAMPTITNNRFEAAPVSPDCPPGTGNQDIGRSADNPGGTYGGKLIYPSSAAN